MDGNRTAALICEFLARHQAQPFDWRANNCLHFAAQWVAMATLVNPMLRLPAVHSVWSAAREVRNYGSLAAAWTYAMAREPIPAALANDGDLLEIDVDGFALLGGTVVALCSGRHAIAQDAFGAILFLPRARALAAWRLWPCHK